jgi:two-component system OmpR family sensor kinase
MRSRLWLVITLTVPAVAGVVAAVVVAAAGGGGTLQVGVPLPTLLVATGVVVSAVAAAIWSTRTALGRASASSYARGRAEAEAAERDAHRRFLRRLDHELKNPITAIRTALAAEQGEEESPNLAVAAGQADRLALLVEELRALASLESRALEREPVDIAAVIREEVEALSHELTARGVAREFSVDLPTAPWPLPQISGDPDLLAVAVRNLLVNAAKYSDPDARIEVRGVEDAGIVMVEVADTGWGIAPDELAQVWDELWRGAHARKVDGSGLGLSLVRLVAHKHGGDATIGSQPGVGTRVRLRIPVTPGHRVGHPPAG